MSEENRTKQTPSSKELKHPVMDTPECGECNLDIYAINKDENGAIPITDSQTIIN